MPLPISTRRTIQQAGFILGSILLMGLAVGCSQEPTMAPVATDEESRSGGATTVFDATSSAFATPAPNLQGESLALHLEGDAAFEAVFVTPPGVVNSGLGPIFNNTSCVGCHPRDGRGRPPDGGEKPVSMLVRISLAGAGPDGGPLAVPGFGTQFQDRAVAGTPSEGRVAVNYTSRSLTCSDGLVVSMRYPVYSIVSPYQPLSSGLLLSPRVAPPVFGLGLLEAVPQSTILALADEADRNGDGISGRVNMVYDVQRGSLEMGRFGWKAGNPTLRQQTAGAYNEDMGITSSLFKMESCHGQQQAQGLPNSGGVEIDDKRLDATTHYTQTLGVPARRNVNDPVVRRGEALFKELGCSGCHVSTLRTGVATVEALSNQTIHPYTDLLLHDMGGDLADGRPDYQASGNEWRTPPLWGIGLTRVVSGHTYFLHDGRARTLLEAIMWHDGEGYQAREGVRRLPTADRNALLSFLESL